MIKDRLFRKTMALPYRDYLLWAAGRASMAAESMIREARRARCASDRKAYAGFAREWHRLARKRLASAREWPHGC